MQSAASHAQLGCSGCDACYAAALLLHVPAAAPVMRHASCVMRPAQSIGTTASLPRAMALVLRRALARACSAQAAPAALQRGFAAGPIGACSGTPEEIFDRKARAGRVPRRRCRVSHTHTALAWLVRALGSRPARCSHARRSVLQWVQVPDRCCAAAAAQVTIYSPARAASQQGKALVGTWKIAFGEGERCGAPRRARNPSARSTTHALALGSSQLGEPADGLDVHGGPAGARGAQLAGV
jgi:hypothetical protein